MAPTSFRAASCPALPRSSPPRRRSGPVPLGLQVADVGVCRRDGGELVEHPRPVVGEDHDAAGKASSRPAPTHFDLALHVVHQVLHVGHIRECTRALCRESHSRDGLPRIGIAALGAVHQQVVDAATLMRHHRQGCPPGPGRPGTGARRLPAGGCAARLGNGARGPAFRRSSFTTPAPLYSGPGRRPGTAARGYRSPSSVPVLAATFPDRPSLLAQLPAQRRALCSRYFGRCRWPSDARCVMMCLILVSARAMFLTYAASLAGCGRAGSCLHVVAGCAAPIAAARCAFHLRAHAPVPHVGVKWRSEIDGRGRRAAARSPLPRGVNV